MITIKETTLFKKDFKKYYKNQNIKVILTDILNIISNKEDLPVKYKNHQLKGKYKNHYECHLLPDTLLIYKLVDNVLILTRIGSHSDLFN